MYIIEKYYHKIKFILLEYKNTLELDSKYMSEYLNTCGKNINDKLADKPLNNEEINIEKKIHTNTNIKNLYKNLARKLHPDKNSNTYNEFIEISKAYEEEDFLTLFIYGYENKQINTLDKNIIDLLDTEIVNIENMITNIKNKIHWQWANSNDLEKIFLNEYINNQL